jgi:hypothetical protein
MMDAVRVLTQGEAAASALGDGAGHHVPRALAWTVAIIVLSGTVAVVRFRRT